MDLVLKSLYSDYLSLGELEKLEGGSLYRFNEAVKSGTLRVVYGHGQSALVARQDFAQYLAAHGNQWDRNSRAASWAHGLGLECLKPEAAPPAINLAGVCSAGMRFAAAHAGKGSRRFAGVAYAGDVIVDHGSHPRIVFDLSSTQVTTPMPTFFSHAREDPVGVIDEATVATDIRVSGSLFTDVAPSARRIIEMADRGLPWQMSVGIYPGQIDEVRNGETVRLNGRSFAGPLKVYRNNRVREVSFVTLGADHRTSARLT